MGGLTYTCPTNWGVLSGSTLSGGIINGWDAANLVDKTSFYIGGTVNTPINGLKAGFAYDYAILGPNNINTNLPGPVASGYQQAGGIYLIWQATPKLSFNTRVELFSQSGYLAQNGARTTPGAGDGLPSKSFELTETLQYDLWKNVVSRLEFRWDHALDASNPFSNGVDNALLVAANLVYKF
jgi:hypothetical protein